MDPEASPLIYNPNAGGGRGTRRATEAMRLLEARGIRVRLTPTASPGGARPIAERLAREGAPRLLVMGGDGTLSEAADGALASGADPVLGFLPGGTGNDFLLGFGVRSLEAAVERVVGAKPRAIDAAVAEQDEARRHWIGVFGTGFMARVTDLANRRFKWLGRRAYAAAVFPELARLSSPHTRLVLDGEVVEDEFPLVAVCNTPHAGGNMRFAPDARPDDGLLDVVALRKVGRTGLLRVFPRIFNGSHIGHPDVYHGRAHVVRIEVEDASPLLADGEVYGETPVTLRVLPGALRALL